MTVRNCVTEHFHRSAATRDRHRSRVGCLYETWCALNQMNPWVAITIENAADDKRKCFEELPMLFRHEGANQFPAPIHNRIRDTGGTLNGSLTVMKGGEPGFLSR